MKLQYVWLLLVVSLTIGCQSEKPTSRGSDPKVATSGATVKPIDVGLALNWFPEAEHGGFYAALVHGYFAEEGLNVTIHSGGPKVPVIANVAEGKVDFGVDNADKLLLSRAQQADVIALMSKVSDAKLPDDEVNALEVLSTRLLELTIPNWIKDLIEQLWQLGYHTAGRYGCDQLERRGYATCPITWG